jgi:uncharacterized damage-inducible protein DinB
VSDRDAAFATGVAAAFRAHLLEEYVPRIGACVARLDAEQLWHRPGPHNNSVANLLLHLEGNTRQWILAGIGGLDDHRDRTGEFAAEAGAGQPSGEELMHRLTTTVQAAVTVVEALPTDQWLAVRRFQDRWERTCLAGVLHVLEHFSGHAGQIYAYTKQVLGVDLKFWDL